MFAIKHSTNSQINYVMTFFRRASTNVPSNVTNGHSGIMKTIDDSYENGKTMYKAKVSDIAQKATNWSLEVGGRNRPVDMARMEDLSNYMAAKRYVPGVIYCFQRTQNGNYWNSNDDTLYIYDGMHRFRDGQEHVGERHRPARVLLCETSATERDRTGHPRGIYVLEQEGRGARVLHAGEYESQAGSGGGTNGRLHRQDVASVRLSRSESTSSRTSRRDILEDRLYKMFEDLFQGDLPDIPNVEETVKGLESTIQEVNEELKNSRSRRAARRTPRPSNTAAICLHTPSSPCRSSCNT